MSAQTKSGQTAKLKKVILDDDKRIDQEVPGSAFGLAALSYFAALIVVLATIGAYFWFVR